MSVDRAHSVKDGVLLPALLGEWRRLRQRGAEMVRLEMDDWCVETLVAEAAAGLPGREHVIWRGMSLCFGQVPITVVDDGNRTFRWMATLGSELLEGHRTLGGTGWEAGNHPVAHHGPSAQQYPGRR